MAGNFVDSLVIGIGLDASQVAQGVQEVGRTIDSGLKGAFDNAVKGASPLGDALKNLRQDAEGLKGAVDKVVEGSTHLGAALKDFGKDAEERALKALNELGIRSTEQIEKQIAKLQELLAKIDASSTLSSRDKQAAIDEITKRIERLKMELEKGIPQAAAEGFAGAEAAAGKFKGFISSLWAQISGPLLGAFAFGGTISSYISNAMSAGELADKLKVDIEEIQIWSGAMDRAGGSAAALQGTIEKLNASGKANGDVFGTLMGLAEKAETMTKEAFTEYAKKLEIDEKTIEVLQQGKKALEEHLQKQEELGVYTKEDAEQSRKFKQALADLLQAWDGLTAFLGRFAVPIMKTVAEVLAKIVAYMRKHPALIAAAIALVGAALTYKLMPPLKMLPALIANVSKAMLRWMPWIAAITALALVFEDFWVYLNGGKSALEKYWKILGDGPTLLKKFKAAWEDVKKVGTQTLENLSNLTKDLYSKMEKHGATDAFSEQFKGNLKLLKGILTGDGKSLGEGLWETISGSFKVRASMSTVLGDALVDGIKKALSLLPSEATFDKWEAQLEKSLSGFLLSLDAKIHKWSAGLFKDLGLPSFDEVSAAFDKLMADIRAKISKWWNSLFSGFKLPRIFGGGDDEEEGPKAEPEAGHTDAKVSEKARGYGEQAADALKAGLGKIGDFFGDMFKDAQPATEDAGAKVESGMKKTADVVQQGFNSAWNATRDFAVTQFQGAAVTIQGIFAGIVSGIETQVGNLVLGAQRMAGGVGMVPAAAGVRAQAAGGRGGNVTVNQNNRINVDARGGDPAKVQRGVERGIDPGRLTRASQSGTVPKG